MDSLGVQSLLEYMQIVRKHNPYVDLLERYGKLWTPQQLPATYPQGPMQECYSNALHLAKQHPELTYVEGLAQGSLIATHHAWCVDPGGNVVDNTWSVGADGAYLGIAFDTTFVAATVVRQNAYGLLANDWRNNSIMLERGFVTDENEHGHVIAVDLLEQVTA